MPTNLERALAKKVELERNESEFTKTAVLLSFAACLLNMLLVLESPAFAAAVNCTAR